ncbi:protein SCO1/2 [Scopulibacillus daqui]|uniref:Protein SCO1/2 n=1 Tax=Scopulibacillus daqui TaxID=1469162 RepID=A0ABS2Q0B3_9BACL|nr:SCO family protein [Scopulibacillus daqui]MBM7645737.1 protein SCO1/2 [Scopulibacillus daqui]
MKRLFKMAVLPIVLLLAMMLSGCQSNSQEQTSGSAKTNQSLNWKVADFNFKDENNRSFGMDQLKGKVWLADFMFTHCTSVCPPMTGNLVHLQKKLKEAKLPVEIVSFSVDPSRDTPEVLKRFAQKHGADFSNWHFLTGYSFDKLKSLSEGSFKSSVAKPSKGSDQFTHGTNIFLVNKEGVIVKKYNGFQDVPYDRIMKDIKELER